MIPGGYSGHLLETDSLSSDEYEEEEDDEINDVLTSHPGIVQCLFIYIIYMYMCSMYMHK